jgi:hypothetical protein
MTELSPEAKALLQQARAGFSPPEGRLEAIRSALQAQMAASPAALAPLASPVSGVATRALGAGGWSAAHSVGAAVLLGALGAGGVVAWLSASGSPAASGASSELIAFVSPRAVSPLPAEESAPLADTASAPIPIPTGQASPVDLAPSSKLAPAPRDRSRALARAHAVPASDSLAEEVSVLRNARAALDRGDPTQALRLVDAHETRFHRGTLYEERLATQVLALCALGRISAARAAAQALEQAAPRSPHLPRVRASCVAQPSGK